LIALSFFEIANVLVRFDHVARFIVNANDGCDRLKNFAEVCDFLTVLVAARTARGTCAACGGCGFARNAAAPAFDVFFCLQVTNFDVSLLHSAPNGPDHIHIVIFVLCLHGPNYFVATFAL